MREILFRGQTRRKGERVRLDGTPVDSNWVYGGVLQGKGDFSIIYQTEPEIEKRTVYTDTLGQYTGLTDKNGNKIFEGDIVRYTFDSPTDPMATENGLIERVGKVFWSDWRSSFAVSVGRSGSNNDLARYCRGRQIYEYVRGANTVEVIGNIFDNPELLESGD